MYRYVSAGPLRSERVMPLWRRAGAGGAAGPARGPAACWPGGSLVMLGDGVTDGRDPLTPDPRCGGAETTWQPKAGAVCPGVGQTAPAALWQVRLLIVGCAGQLGLMAVSSTTKEVCSEESSVPVNLMVTDWPARLPSEKVCW